MTDTQRLEAYISLYGHPPPMRLKEKYYTEAKGDEINTEVLNDLYDIQIEPQLPKLTIKIEL